MRGNRNVYQVRFYLSLLLLVLFAIFTVQNAAVVTIHFLFWKFSVSRVLMIIFVLVLGILIGWFSAGYYRHLRDSQHSR